MIKATVLVSADNDTIRIKIEGFDKVIDFSLQDLIVLQNMVEKSEQTGKWISRSIEIDFPNDGLMKKTDDVN